MIDDPYRVAGPALISFSGGRTSAYMLHKILRAHDGKLPDNVHVTFANTGKEREETLRFVHECGSRWGVRVHWLERIPGGGFGEVGFNSASRNGEPFSALIREKRYLPNAVTRFCTIELKIRVMRDFALRLGWDKWNNIVGLRYDEGERVFKALARNDSGKERFTTLMPLSKAKVTKPDVKAFWAAQPFDLGLRDYEGNCDLCFLKGRGKLCVLLHENPGMGDWWISQERNVSATKPSGARFITEFPYAELADFVDRQGSLFAEPDDDQDYDVECGLYCGAEAP